MNTPRRPRAFLRSGLARLAAIALLGVLPLAGPLPAGAVPVAGASGAGDSYFPLDGNGGIDVRRYRIRDRYRFVKGRLGGHTGLRIRATEELSSFNLDFLLPVREVRVDGEAAAFTRPNRHELSITPPSVLADGERFRVRVEYAGRPGRIEWDGESNWLASRYEVVAMNEPHMAPWWFPANDHPSDKARMDIAITVPRGQQVFANGHRESRTRHGRLVTHRWVAEEPMATYLAMFAAGRFRVDRGVHEGLPWRAIVSERLFGWDTRANLDLMRRTPRIVAELARDLGDYPFSTTGGLVTSLPVGFALENQTLPTYPSTSRGRTSLVVHEQAHQWFGDSVTLSRWRDIWLNEGAATFMEARYAEQHGGQTADQWLRDQYDHRPDAFWDLVIGDPGPTMVFAEAVYVRGGMTFQALRNRIGDEDFWLLLRRWLTDNRHGNGTREGFEALAEEVSGEQLDGFFQAWLDTPDRPADVAANGLG